MKGRIRRCPSDMTYTLSERCPLCNGETVSAHPARFSPADRYSRYRRIVRGWKT
ncbi:MAG: RNA-protein complex protein Nop10 [Methanoregulaceae archaeon]|nr:RNA-protein complex protein Nop10 [Methanoregulaceae archaeon]